MSKKQKSELQKAVDRVEAMKIATEKTEKNMKVCHDVYKKAQAKLEESERNLRDTQDFYNAQCSKLWREQLALQKIINPNYWVGTNNAVSEKQSLG